MINLIPKERKDQIRAEYRFRWFKLGAYLAGVMFVFGVISLVPSLASISYRSALFKSDAQKIEDRIIQLEKEKKPLQTQTELRRKITLLSDDATKQALPSDVLLALARRRTPQVTLDVVAYEKLTESKGEARSQIQVGGIAADRNALLSLLASFEAEPLFVDVASPISNLVRDRALRFTITILAR